MYIIIETAALEYILRYSWFGMDEDRSGFRKSPAARVGEDQPIRPNPDGSSFE